MSNTAIILTYSNFSLLDAIEKVLEPKRSICVMPAVRDILYRANPAFAGFKGLKTINTYLTSLPHLPHPSHLTYLIRIKISLRARSDYHFIMSIKVNL